MTGETREEAKASMPPGWQGLIDDAYNGMSPETHVIRVEKRFFGNLRIYVYACSQERRSEKTCVVCGQTGKIRKIHGRWESVCKQHQEEMQ
jgi:hypothetical protein